jgi:hypothetical protein
MIPKSESRVSEKIVRQEKLSSAPMQCELIGS